MSIQYTVTRQRQFPDGACVVEISAGGLDYTNPDALASKYAGEFETFTGLVPAVDAAISIAEQWQRDSKESIGIAIGATGGNTLPFDGDPLTPDTIASLREFARKHDEALEKCAGCGEILPAKRNRWKANEWDGLEYCSEDCATRAAEFEAQEQSEFEAQEQGEDS